MSLWNVECGDSFPLYLNLYRSNHDQRCFYIAVFLMTNCYKMYKRQKISMPRRLLNLRSGCRPIKYGTEGILFSPHVFCVVFVS